MGDDVRLRSCLTDAIDIHPSGKNFYHYHDTNRVLMRPRIPLRYDFNEVSIEEVPNMDTQSKTGQRLSSQQRTDHFKIFQIKRTWHSTANTILLYTMSIILLITSFINMRKVYRALQEDNTLQAKDKNLFRVVFSLSFVVVIFILCYLSISVFELFHNVYPFSKVIRGNIKYTKLNIKDGIFQWGVLIFVFVCVLISSAEAINIFFMEPDNPIILFIFIPIMLFFVIFINLYVLYF